MSPAPALPDYSVYFGWLGHCAFFKKQWYISRAYTPTWDHFMETYPHGLLQASELFVGLPFGQMGNSEVGHMTMGAGRVILQDLPRIDISLGNEASKDGTG